MTACESYLDANQTRYLGELLELLRIPSISSLPEHAGDVRDAAEWVAARLTTAGIENVRVMPTAGHPVVYGDWLHAPSKPTVLIYGHFDTQPVDPVELWTAPPFEPTTHDGRIYARGASDDKGNMLIPILAVEASLQSSGSLPLNLKFFFEGEEEIGSPDLPAFVQSNAELFACDVVISADGAQLLEDRPSLLVSLKGLCGIQIDVHGAQTDLHSGIYGGTLQNPIEALAHILASLRAEDGTILVERFFDDVAPLTENDRTDIAAVPFNEAQVKDRLGVSGFFGEPGYTPAERMGARPTLEINGIWGGFQGEGVKTVIPKEAHAKITCRLVAHQNPEKIIEALVRHVEAHTPPGVSVTVTPLPATADPYLLPSEHWATDAAAEVLTDVYQVQPIRTRTGGSVPVTAIFLRYLDAYTITFAFGLNDEQFHAPDEFFRLSSFERGQRAYCRLLARLGR